MENSEILQHGQGWQGILPEHALPDDVDSWIIETPQGRAHLGLGSEKGSDAYGSDMVYAVSDSLDGIVANGFELVKKGYKTLNFSLTPSQNQNNLRAELRRQGSGKLFVTILSKLETDERNRLKPMSYWHIVPEADDEDHEARDIMITRNVLAEMQIRFPQGGDN